MSVHGKSPSDAIFLHNPTGFKDLELSHWHEVIAKAFHEAQGQKVFSGASLLVANGEEILYERAFGTISAGGPPLSLHSLFDLASLTKPLATTLVCMSALTRKLFDVHAPIGHFIPTNLIPRQKKNITILHLLNHCSGLPAYVPFYQNLIRVPPRRRKESLLLSILQTPLDHNPGEEARYSDLDFMLLGTILEETLGDSMEKLFQSTVQALIMEDTGEHSCSRGKGAPGGDITGGHRPVRMEYIPLEAGWDPTHRTPCLPVHHKTSFVATEFCSWRKRILHGEVHDENAYVLGGVAPHAGLFGTAAAIHRVLSTLWRIYRGEWQTSQMSQEVLQFFWRRPGIVPRSTWALGFDSPSQKGSSAGRYFSEKSIGHLGFTGTSFWLDTVRGLLIILLTNRVHISRNNDKIKTFRPYIHDLIMEKMT